MTINFLKIARILLALSIILIFQQQLFFDYFLKRGIFLNNFLIGLAFVPIVLSYASWREIRFKNNLLIVGGFVFVGAVSVASFCISPNFFDSFKYCIVIVYSFLFTLSVIIAFNNKDIRTMLSICCYSIIIASIIGIYDFMAFNANLPTFNKHPEPTQIISGFIHFGTTADYAQIMLSILTPLVATDFFIQSDKKFRRLVYLAIVLGIILLVGTSRISVIISYFLSLAVFGIMIFKKSNLKKVLQFATVVTATVGLLFLAAPTIFESFIYRMEVRIFARQPKTLAGDFFIENSKQSYATFIEHPLYGVGIGNSRVLVNELEFGVHGAFLRLISETGIIGTVGFIIFIGCIITFVLKNKKQQYFHHFFPFFIGLLISCVYNILFFRIEFWLVIAILYLFAKQEVFIDKIVRVQM